MPIINRVAEMHDEVTAWRRHLHTIPELLYDVHQTAAFVADKLREFGCDEVVTGIGRTGVVGIIRGKLGDGPVVGLRADMDALPLTEVTGKPYASQKPGVMHACGHDGHTAMLLGAAKYLAETRNFRGAVAAIFQPAEEGGAGGRAMVEDGMMDRFGITSVFGMHNMPGLPVGEFAICHGPIMAATAEFRITVNGKGGHAAMPHKAIDPIVVGAQIVQALQTIVSRGTDPLDAAVVSVTQFHAGDTHNIIPTSAFLGGTIRTLRQEVSDATYRRISEIAEGIAAACGASADVEIIINYPVTVNHADETEFSIRVAEEIAGAGKVDPQLRPLMASEDFSYMLEARHGCFIFVGNGDTANLHNPAYDFNDDALPHGISYWVRLAEQALGR